MSSYPENFNEEYTSFLNNLIHLFPNNDVLNSVSNETVDERYSRLIILISTLDNQTNFNNFVKSKIKTFSHKETDKQKISESLFGKNLSLKKIFNNQDDTIKLLLWNHLHRLVYIVYQNENNSTTDKNKLERISRLKELQKSTASKKMDPKETLQSFLKTDNLNTSTNEMINDIFSSFEGSLTGKNPLENIFNISNLITDKYKDKIENGDIDLNSLLDGLQTNLPGMENMKSMIDPILKMQGQPEEPKETVIMDENFSTADVDLGKQEELSQPALGNMLKAIDSTGLMNMLGSSGGGFPDLGNQTEGIGKFMGMLSKLQNVDSNNPDEVTNIFKNELGLDVDKLNEQMAKMMNQNQ
jgi:hypothetical protein